MLWKCTIALVNRKYPQSVAMLSALLGLWYHLKTAIEMHGSLSGYEAFTDSRENISSLWILLFFRRNCASL